MNAISIRSFQWDDLPTLVAMRLASRKFGANGKQIRYASGRANLQGERIAPA
jgi:hypothetical protein